jgi:hypothetical protein
MASVLAKLYDYRVLALSLVYFGAIACGYGVSFWMPTIVKGFGLSIAMTGWVSAIPYVVGFCGMVWWELRSDHRGERTMHLAVSLALSAAGIGGSAFLADPVTKMIALTRRAWAGERRQIVSAGELKRYSRRTSTSTTARETSKAAETRRPASSCAALCRSTAIHG